MSWNNIKIDKADSLFSQYIRRRDGRCVSCGKQGKDDYGINGLQCSHFWSRRNESTRFDKNNCDALCAGCHHRWGGDYRGDYVAFKLKQLGQQAYDALEVKAHTYQKRDRKLAYLAAKELLKTLD